MKLLSYKGSFGHFHAKKYELKTGGSHKITSHSSSITTSSSSSNNNNEDINKKSSSWQYGLALTRQSVLKLNTYVIDSLISKHIPATSISPFPTTKTSKQLNTDNINNNDSTNNNTTNNSNATTSSNNSNRLVNNEEFVYNDGIITPGIIYISFYLNYTIYIAQII